MNIANKDGFRFGETAYLIGNEFGLICVAYGAYESDALDHAVDCGFMDSELMSDKDHAEYSSNGWDGSFICAGNASEPFWSEYLWIKPASERKLMEVTA
jgi:hypothetical protein